MKQDTKLIIAIIIVMVIFIIGYIPIAIVKLNSRNSFEDTSSVSSEIIDSDSITNSNNSIDDTFSNNNHNSNSNNNTNSDSNIVGNPSSSTSSNIQSGSTSSIENSNYIPDYERPDTEYNLSGIDFSGFNNLTITQDNEVTRLRLGQLVSDATLGKTIDFAKILDSSTNDRVLIDVYFNNGEVVNYTVLFDNLNTFNFTRCVTTSMYDFIMGGGVLG